MPTTGFVPDNEWFEPQKYPTTASPKLTVEGDHSIRVQKYPREPRVNAEDITLTEVEPSYRWTATLDGSAYSVDPYTPGPRVIMERTGATSYEAYENLVSAIEEQGWILRDNA